MKYINKYLRGLTPYKVASHKIWDVKPSERESVLKLDWNEATIPPTPLVQKRMQELVAEANFYNYYPSTYNNTVHELLSAYCELPKENIQYFASSDALHEYITRVYISVGDPILILGPTYDNFRLTCESQGARFEFSNYSIDFEFDADKFEKDIDRVKPSLVYICNPNNPTGYWHSTEYIAGLLTKYPDTLFLIDEAYYEFSIGTAKDLVLHHDNILISRTFSKAFALANFRAGYLLSSIGNINNISKVRNAKNFTTFSQEACIAVLSDVPYMREYVAEVRKSKDDFEIFLKSNNFGVQVFPSEGNFLLMKFNSGQLMSGLIKEFEAHNIFLRSLSHSELLKNCLRITIGTRIQMERVKDVMLGFYESVSNELESLKTLQDTDVRPITNGQ